MKKVTIKDVAKQAGVSIGTVSKVLNDKDYVSKEARKRIEEVMGRLNYQVNANARSLKSSKTHKVGVIVSDISNNYMMSMAKAIEDMLRTLNYHMLVMSHNESPSTERELIQLLMEQRVDGLVLVPTGENMDMIGTVLNQKIPVVLVDRKVEGISSDLIEDDNFFGSYEAVSYLNSLGHTRIGVIYGTLVSSIGKERLEGALEAIKERNCALDPSLIVSGNFTPEDAYRATIELLLMPEPPTAIYCCNNTMTVGMLKAIMEQGLSIPNDISVIVFGDSQQWELFRPPLTLMTQSLKRIGVEAAIILKNRLTMPNNYEPRHIVMRPELVVKGSCKRLE
jgi:LacI family transcriptional regulator